MKKSFHSNIAFIGIGSNLEKPVSQCRLALKRIEGIDSIKLLKRSLLYETEPIGYIKQPWFVNAVIEIHTTLSPHELLSALGQIETEMGRIRGEKGGPRAIDLDILLFNEMIIHDDDLVIPHPELHKRRFVMVPLTEIASQVIHPVFGISMRELLTRLDDENKVLLLNESF